MSIEFRLSAIQLLVAEYIYDQLDRFSRITSWQEYSMVMASLYSVLPVTKRQPKGEINISQRAFTVWHEVFVARINTPALFQRLFYNPTRTVHRNFPTVAIRYTWSIIRRLEVRLNKYIHQLRAIDIKIPPLVPKKILERRTMAPEEVGFGIPHPSRKSVVLFTTRCWSRMQW